MDYVQIITMLRHRQKLSALTSWDATGPQTPSSRHSDRAGSWITYLCWGCVRATCFHNDACLVALVCYLLGNNGETQYTDRQVIPRDHLVFCNAALSGERLGLFCTSPSFSVSSAGLFLVTRGKWRLKIASPYSACKICREGYYSGMWRRINR
jgi:hypothetical protein